MSAPAKLTRRPRGRWYAAVALFSALAVLLAGCSGSDNDSGSDSTSAGSSAPALSGEYKVFVITGINVPVGNQPAAGDAVKAAVERVNGRGGFGGLKGVVEVCNSLGTGPGTQACGQKAVDAKADQVFCLCSFPTANDVLDAAGIPRFGANGQTDADFAAALNFMMHGSSAEAYLGSGFAVQRKGAKSIMAAGYDLAATKALAGYTEIGAKAAGIQYKGFASIAQSTTDYSSMAQQIKQANPDALALLIAPTQYTTLLQTLKEFGMTNLKYFIPAFAVGDPDLKSVGALADGFITFSPVPPFNDESFPIVKEYRQDMKNVSDCCRPFEFSAYIAVYGIEALAKKVVAAGNKVTKDSMMAAARDPKTGVLDVAGIWKWRPWASGPSNFARVPDGTGYFVTIKSQKYVLDGDKTPFDLWTKLGYRTA